MTAVSEADSSLATQRLDFCQALARQGKDFKLSITIGSTFSFSLDTKEGKATLPTKIKKKKSPSTLKRNAKRREDFLAKKSTVVTGLETNQNQCEAFPCEQCDSRFKTANGLKIHKGKAHKEVLRKHTEGSVSLSASPFWTPPGRSSASTQLPGRRWRIQPLLPNPLLNLQGRVEGASSMMIHVLTSVATSHLQLHLDLSGILGRSWRRFAVLATRSCTALCAVPRRRRSVMTE